MRTRLSSTALLLLAALAAGCGESAADEPYRPAVPVDLTTLRARSHPDATRESGAGSFDEILTLRDAPDPDSVPALTGIVEDHVGSGRIHRYAAMQALFTEGSDEALRALDEHALRGDLHGDSAYSYAFHWKMEPGPRDEYLERYVLRDAGVGPTVELERLTGDDSPVWRPNAKLDPITLQRFDFRVTFRNDGAEPLTLSARRSAGGLLVFRARGGHFVRSTPGSTRCGGPLEPIVLAPGETYPVHETVRVLRSEDGTFPNGAEIGARADGYGNFLHQLDEPGEFDVIAFWTSRTGRRVSKSVRVTVRAP